ncbi:DNA topology modulation protein FlaR [Saccharopolyspora hattusasensis]|uniref:DNA topology modulation protein FlaR n=1 Tax=Saccharopolyspora hattusasensis TaxID=1128679 RepID=UPI003D98F1F6
MRKIMICGCGGSGKSALARQLGERLNLPVTHLDMEYYDECWQPLDSEAFTQRQRALVAEGEWVLDGNYASTMPIRLTAADTVIFLDLPGLTCLWGILQRRHQHHGSDALSRHLRGRITWGFIRYILGYRRTMRPKVDALIAEHASSHVITLRSRRQVRRFLNDLHVGSGRA